MPVSQSRPETSTAELSVYHTQVHHTQISPLCPTVGWRKEDEDKELWGEASSMESLQPPPTLSGYYVLRRRR